MGNVFDDVMGRLAALRHRMTAEECAAYGVRAVLASPPAHHSSSEALAFLDDVKPALQLIPYGDGVRLEAERLFRECGRDHRLSFCDAISFVVVTTLLDHPACLTFDRDFRSLGLTVFP